MMQVIYVIKHLESGRFYVGRTKDFDRRKREHFSQLSCGTHYNKKLQNIYKKYGRDSLTIDVAEIAICESIEDVEQRWLDAFIKDPLCLNTSSSSWMPKNSDLSEDQRRYIKSRASEHLKRANKDPSFIQKRDAASSKNMKKSWSNPDFIDRHKRRSSEVMRAQNQDSEFIKKMLTGNKAQHSNPDIVKRRLLASANAWQKSVVIIRLSDGASFTFGSCKEASEKLGLRQSSISMCCHGKLKTTKGYRCEFA